MRRIVVDLARSQGASKRGGNLCRVSLDEDVATVNESSVDLVALDEALQSLAAIDPRKSRVVELSFFGGLNIAETAEVLKVSHRTVVYDLRFAKAWLHRAMKGEVPEGEL